MNETGFNRKFGRLERVIEMGAVIRCEGHGQLSLSPRVPGQALRVYTGSRVGTVVLALKDGHDPEGLGAAVAWTEGKGTELRVH